MAVNQEPQEYKYKHQERIILDGYTGIASGAMQLNEPIADGFMRVADMRKDIVVVRRGEPRVVSYETLDDVVVGKMVSMKMGGRNQRSDVMSTNWGNEWTIEIDDQALWKKVTNTDSVDNKKPEERFVEAFRGEIRKGTREFLWQEKIFNNGGQSPLVTSSYATSGVIASLEMIHGTAAYLVGANPTEFAVNSAIFIATGDLIGNTLNWCLPRIFASRAKLHNMDPDMPFVKRSFPDFFMPTIPVDRLVRGLAYDATHGSKLITHAEAVG
jgi:hypothetical protein